MNISEAAINAALTADLLDRVRLAHESLAFCAEVFQRYQSGEKPNEHMDLDKARNQLIDSIFRTLQAGKGL
jgi:hypothetical protein